MRKNPERLAWAVLLASFGTCLALAVAVPLTTRAVVLYARMPQPVVLEVQRAPLRVLLAGRGVPVAVTETRTDIPERTTIATDSTAGQLLVSAPGPGAEPVARVQIYDDTEMTLLYARSPRFRASRLPHQVVLSVARGRVRIGVFDAEQRPTTVEVATPYGRVKLIAGSYEVKVMGETAEVAVRDGRAVLSAVTASLPVEPLVLGPAERAVVQNGRVVGPLAGARNLIANGDFRLPLDAAGSWSSYDEQTDPQQPRAQVRLVVNQGRSAAEFFRQGSNHAEVGIRQPINYDVRDFSFLELHLAVRIDMQNIAGYGGCGYLSSECPIIVALKYKDINGNDQEWLHGFYTGDPAPGWPLHPWTERVAPGVWYSYDSGNLMEELSATPPATVKEIVIYASGHSFRAFVSEVELLAQE